MKNEDIKCSVESCQYHDKQQYCTLNSIQVGQTKAMGEAKDTKDTECASFKSE